MPNNKNNMFWNSIYSGIEVENQTNVGDCNVSTSLNASWYGQTAQIDVNSPLKNRGTIGISSTVGNDFLGLYSSHSLDVKFDDKNSLGLEYNSRTQEVNALANIGNFDFSYTQNPNLNKIEIETQNSNTGLFFGMIQDSSNGANNRTIAAQYGFSDTKDNSFYYGNINARYEDKTNYRNYELGVSGTYGNENATVAHGFFYSEQQITPGTTNSTFWGQVGIFRNFNLPDYGSGSVSARIQAESHQNNISQKPSQLGLNFGVGASVKPNKTSYLEINASSSYQSKRNGAFSFGALLKYSY